jgi:hypothetical protein
VVLGAEERGAGARLCERLGLQAEDPLLWLPREGDAREALRELLQRVIP